MSAICSGVIVMGIVTICVLWMFSDREGLQ